MKVGDISKDDFQILGSYKVVGTQIGELYGLKLLENRLPVASGVSFIDQEERNPLREITEFEWTLDEQDTRQLESRQEAGKTKKARSLRQAAMLNHDPRSGIYESPCNDTRDTLPYNEGRLLNKQPRAKKNIAVINAEWNAFYNSKS